MGGEARLRGVVADDFSAATDLQRENFEYIFRSIDQSIKQTINQSVHKSIQSINRQFEEWILQ